MDDDTSSKPGKPRVEPEMLVGISAVLIGICALGVSLHETNLMRKEQRAAVIPLIELGRSYSLDNSDVPTDGWRLSLHIENVGIGPARVGDFRVTVDGVAMATWGDAFRTLIGRDEVIPYGQSTINGRTVPPERSISLFTLGDRALTKDIIDEFGRLDFEACFCSIFDECWTTSFSTFGAAEEIGKCERSGESFRE